MVGCWLAACFAAERLWRSPATPAGRSREARHVIVSVLVGATVIVITALTLLSYFTTGALTADKPDALVIRLRSYQWWWEFIWIARPDHVITDANEIHVPVGQPVHILLEAPDVIHSFWVPSLSGKKDLIPGRNNEITMTAERPGTYRGQCAQFCGLQHAHMAFLVVADPPEAFAAWRSGPIAARRWPVERRGGRGAARFPLQALRRVPYNRGHDGRRHPRP